MEAARLVETSKRSNPKSNGGTPATGPAVSVAYKTQSGIMYEGTAEAVLNSRFGKMYRGKTQLILTSPPFPLNRKKKYGNLRGQEYVDWLAAFAPIFRGLLTENGSIVMEMGNAWQPGEPVMSTLALEALLKFLKAGDLKLCQQFVCYNPARLPTPAQWVNIERIRVKDAYTHVWWMAPSTRPKANNRNVLRKYSKSMLRLLRTQKYNSGKRPSEHAIGKTSFLSDNKGAIPSNVLTYTNTLATDRYLKHCRDHDLSPHPARMPIDLANFFVEFLTTRGDRVVDPFAGSNVVGAAAQGLGRKWMAIEADATYISGSRGRFLDAE